MIHCACKCGGSVSWQCDIAIHGARRHEKATHWYASETRGSLCQMHPCIVCVPNALATKLCHTHTQVSHACFTGIHDIYCIKISWVLCKQTSSICMKAFFSAFVDCMPQQESVCVWTLRPCWSPWAQKLAQVLQSDAEKHITWIHTKRQVIVWCLGHSQRYEVWQVIRLGKPNCLLRLLPVFTRTCCKIST